MRRSETQPYGFSEWVFYFLTYGLHGDVYLVSAGVWRQGTGGAVVAWDPEFEELTLSQHSARGRLEQSPDMREEAHGQGHSSSTGSPHMSPVLLFTTRGA